MSSVKKSDTTFEHLDLSDVMMRALKRAGYHEPSPIQGGVIPLVLDGYDVVGQAQTGTGKTAAFGIPILECLDDPDDCPGPQALVLVPTRELAVQVRDEIGKLAYGDNIDVVALYGGQPIRGQIEKLKRGVQIVVGTPGRVLDHISRKSLKLDDLWCVVLDEADRMLDIGFRPDIEKILRRCPKDRQTLLLSATLPPPIKRLAERYMHKPEYLDFSPTDIAANTIDQYYFTVDQDRKFGLLVRLLERENPKQAIIFCRTRKGTDKVFKRLSKHVDTANCIHGDMQQRVRDRVMKQFREGKLQYLVATDIVGRGIDVSGISHIVNYDIPQFCDDYVHRVGRTGRMGREGVAFTFVTVEQGEELTRIEQRINKLLKRGEIEDYETEKPKPAPEEAGEAKPNPAAALMKRPPKRYRRGL